MKEKKYHICAGIVTYNPNIILLKRNIESIYNQVEEIIIFDNGLSNFFKINELVKTYNNCSIIHSNENKGISFALNCLCEWGEKQHYNWIITLDQDSISPKDMVTKLVKYIRSDVAIIAPNIVYKNNEKYAKRSKKDFIEVPWVITSASMTNISVWKRLNGFDEWLFIDGVDYDYGIRANRAGYKVIMSYDTELLHELGNLKCLNIMGRIIYVTNHSALRKYYMARNTIYLRKKLHEGKPIRTILKYVVKVALFEEEKKEKIKAIVHGVVDGVNKICERKNK